MLTDATQTTSLPCEVTATILVLQSLGSAGIGLGAALHNGLATGRETGVVLNVAFGEPLIGLVPMAVSEQIDDDMHGGLLILVEHGVLVREQGGRIVNAYDWSGLPEDLGRGDQRNHGDVKFHAYYRCQTRVWCQVCYIALCYLALSLSRKKVLLTGLGWGR